MSLERINPKEPKILFFRHLVRKAFLEDWALKLTALVITFVLWLGVTGLSTPAERSMKVPLNLSLANNTEITNDLPQDVEIVLSGDKRKLDQINKSDLSATVDLTEIAPGGYVVSLSPENVTVALPPGIQGIKLKDVSPSKIGINLEAVEEKDVEVKIQPDGMPADGYEVYYSNAIPQKIRVRGPESFMKTLDFVGTDKINLTGKTGEFTAKQVPVNVSSSKASVQNTVVDVYFRIGEKRVERSFTILVSPGKTVAFTIFGPRTLVARAKADSFKVEIIKGEMGEEIPQLILPAEMQDVVEIKKLVVK